VNIKTRDGVFLKVFSFVHLGNVKNIISLSAFLKDHMVIGNKLAQHAMFPCDMIPVFQVLSDKVYSKTALRLESNNIQSNHFFLNIKTVIGESYS
jgi:hypothetical protein